MGGVLEYHIQQDVIPLLNGDTNFKTMDGIQHRIDGKWDLIVAHPPCTYLTCTGNRWFDEEKYGDKARQRKLDREKAILFFMQFVNADCNHIAIENPIGIMSTKYRKPDQIIQPYQFGDPVSKSTCLWLKGLPLLHATKIVEPEKIRLKNGKLYNAWHYNTWLVPPLERSKVRSKTFPGIAKAIADQWGGICE